MAGGLSGLTTVARCTYRTNGTLFQVKTYILVTLWQCAAPEERGAVAQQVTRVPGLTQDVAVSCGPRPGA